MPIVEIAALPQRAHVNVARTLESVSSELAKVLGVRPQAVKAIWTSLPPNHYAEGGAAAAEQPPRTHPPLASITALSGRPPELIEKAIACVAEALAKELGLPLENLLVVYHEIPPGRLFTNGALKR